MDNLVEEVSPSPSPTLTTLISSTNTNTLTVDDLPSLPPTPLLESSSSTSLTNNSILTADDLPPLPPTPLLESPTSTPPSSPFPHYPTTPTSPRPATPSSPPPSPRPATPVPPPCSATPISSSAGPTTPRSSGPAPLPPVYLSSFTPPTPAPLNLSSDVYKNVEVLVNNDPPVIVQPIIIYQSMPGHPQEGFYNPDYLFNQREFVMRANVEYILLIYPSDVTEQIIYPGHLPNPPESNIIVKEEPQVLALKVKHFINEMAMLVPVHTPLSFLLRTTNLQIKMHTIPLKEAEQCKKALHTNYLLLDLPPLNAPHRLVMFDERPSPRATPYYFPGHSATVSSTTLPNRPYNLLNRRYDRCNFIN